MNYYKIGDKVRKYRKAINLSQEELSEKIGISVTHMSHIETGNTKLSLPVLVALAEALDVHTDDLLFDMPSNKNIILTELNELLETCSEKELSVITDVVKILKKSFNKHLQ